MASNHSKHGPWYHANIATPARPGTSRYTGKAEQGLAEFAGDPILRKLRILSPDGIPTKFGIGVGVVIMAALGYGVYHVVQMRNLEKYGPKNLRQMRRLTAARRMRLPRGEDEVYSEYGGRALNTRQLARLGLI